MQGAVPRPKINRIGDVRGLPPTQHTCKDQLRQPHSLLGASDSALRWRKAVIGGDMNMGLGGAIPELRRRGLELHLCAVHAELSDAERKWCWDSMGIWAVGPFAQPAHGNVN